MLPRMDFVQIIYCTCKNSLRALGVGYFSTWSFADKIDSFANPAIPHIVFLYDCKMSSIKFLHIGSTWSVECIANQCTLWFRSRQKHFEHRSGRLLWHEHLHISNGQSQHMCIQWFGTLCSGAWPAKRPCNSDGNWSVSSQINFIRQLNCHCSNTWLCINIFTV